jgi:hypothetical protein
MNDTTSRIDCTTTQGVVPLLILGCARCGMTFGITRDFEQRRRDDHRSFYCPNGHENAFQDDTEVDRLKATLQRAHESRRYAYDQLSAARQLAQTERRRAAAAKGQLTKMRNKVARGECPMSGCGESFSDLHAHVTEQHPELAEALTEATADV